MNICKNVSLLIYRKKKLEKQELEKICKWGELNQHAFISTYEEVLERDGNVNDLDLNDISSFSTSCFEKEKDAKRMMKFFTKKNPQAILAYGNIKKKRDYHKKQVRESQNKNHMSIGGYIKIVLYIVILKR